MTDLSERGTMTAQDFDEWVAALEENRYPQGHTALQDSDGGYCCLGVRCVLAEVDLDQTAQFKNSRYQDYTETKPLGEFGGTLDFEIHDTPLEPVLGQIPEWARKELADLNDGTGGWRDTEYTFPQIAEWLISNREFIVAE
jgi:hypothetical protein